MTSDKSNSWKTLLRPVEVLACYPPHDGTLHGMLASRASSRAGADMLRFEKCAWSWNEFQDGVGRVAAALHARGVRRGDRVGILAANHPAHLLLLFGVARLGAIFVPVNPEYGVAEARYVLEHAGVCALVCTDATQDTARDAVSAMAPAPWLANIDGERPGAMAFDALCAVPRAPPPFPDVAPDDTLIVLYTSGTTGFPKGVMHCQRSFVLAGERQVERVRLQPDDRALCVLPLFHNNALFNITASVLAAGACLVLEPRFSASRFWRVVKDHRVTQVNVMAAISTILARRPRDEYVQGHALRVVNGSGFTQETLDVFRDDFHVPVIIEGLGMTEIPGAFSNPYEGPHKLAAMGKPGLHPDHDRTWTQARIVDDDGRDVPAGEVGELLVRIPTMMQGYWRDPALTAASFIDGWFATGDLVRCDADGYFHHVARKKDIIRRRGENIAAAELDRVIGEHPGVAEAAVVPVPADVGEEEILAIVVPRAGTALAPADIRDWCAARLAAYKVPRYIAFADSLPHTPTHKVARHVLRAQAGDWLAHAVDCAPTGSASV